MMTQHAAQEPARAKSSRVRRVRLVGREDVYNMEVDTHHNFAIQGGLIVHNCEAARYGLMSRPARTVIKQPPKPKPYDPLADDTPTRRGFLGR